MSRQMNDGLGHRVREASFLVVWPLHEPPASCSTRERSFAGGDMRQVPNVEDW